MIRLVAILMTIAALVIPTGAAAHRHHPTYRYGNGRAHRAYWVNCHGQRWLSPRPVHHIRPGVACSDQIPSF